jgi:hypothetical protein
MITKAMRFVIRRPAGEDGSNNGGGQAEGVSDAQAQDDGDPAADAASKAVEDKAREMGWTPKDQFKGDPSKWRDASEFVERGEKLLPIVQAKVKKQEAELRELRATVKDLGDFVTKTEQRAYDRALADLTAQRAAAIEAGDGKAFTEIDEQIQSVRAEVVAKAQKQAAKAETTDPEYEEWAGRNKWLEDPAMSAYAESMAIYLRKSGEKATGSDFLELVAKEVKAKFPEKFTNPRRAAAPAVESGAPAPRKGGKGFADMPADARAACDRMARNLFNGDEKAMAKFKADYVKNHFEGEAA